MTPTPTVTDGSFLVFAPASSLRSLGGEDAGAASPLSLYFAYQRSCPTASNCDVVTPLVITLLVHKA